MQSGRPNQRNLKTWCGFTDVFWYEAKLWSDTAEDIDRKKQTHDNICLHVVYPEDWEEHTDFDKILLDADMVGGGFLVLFRILSEIPDWLPDEPWSDGAVFTIWPVLKAAANSTKNLIISQTLGLNCGSWPERGIRLLIDPALTFSWQN